MEAPGAFVAGFLIGGGGGCRDDFDFDALLLLPVPDELFADAPEFLLAVPLPVELPLFLVEL